MSSKMFSTSSVCAVNFQVSPYSSNEFECFIEFELRQEHFVLKLHQRKNIVLLLEHVLYMIIMNCLYYNIQKIPIILIVSMFMVILIRSGH